MNGRHPVRGERSADVPPQAGSCGPMGVRAVSGEECSTRGVRGDTVKAGQARSGTDTSLWESAADGIRSILMLPWEGAKRRLRGRRVRGWPWPCA